MKHIQTTVTWEVPDDCSEADLLDVLRFQLDVSNLSVTDIYDPSACKVVAVKMPSGMTVV